MVSNDSAVFLELKTLTSAPLVTFPELDDADDFGKVFSLQLRILEYLIPSRWSESFRKSGNLGAGKTLVIVGSESGHGLVCFLRYMDELVYLQLVLVEVLTGDSGRTVDAFSALFRTRTFSIQILAYFHAR